MIPISGLYIALTALLLLILAGLVVRQRRKLRVALLDGGQEAISVAMRAQANTLENAVPFLLLLVACELNGSPAWLLHTCGTVFVLARIAHAYGFSTTAGKLHAGRFYGTLLNWVALLVLIIWQLITSIVIL